MDDLNSKILLDLSDNQKKAVTHPLKPLLVIAGPGSGKTRVMAHRIPWLVNNYNIKPYEILAVTFTNKAAAEMKGRILEDLDKLSSGRGNKKSYLVKHLKIS